MPKTPDWSQILLFPILLHLIPYLPFHISILLASNNQECRDVIYYLNSKLINGKQSNWIQKWSWTWSWTLFEIGHFLNNYQGWSNCNIIYKQGIIQKDNNKIYIVKDNTGYLVIWSKENRIHRKYGPAVVKYINTPLGIDIVRQEWYMDGVLHRDNGPAIKLFNNQICQEHWYQQGLLHREDEPAIIYKNQYNRILESFYYYEGQAHLEDGRNLRHCDHLYSSMSSYYFHNKFFLYKKDPILLEKEKK